MGAPGRLERSGGSPQHREPQGDDPSEAPRL